MSSAIDLWTILKNHAITENTHCKILEGNFISQLCSHANEMASGKTNYFLSNELITENALHCRLA